MKMKKLLPILLGLGLWVGGSQLAEAATIHVSTTGNNLRTKAQAAYRDSAVQTVQQAITLAADGDIIVVGAGTFTGAVAVNKRVQIVGAGNDAAGTILSGAITLNAAENGTMLQALRNLRSTGGITVNTSYYSEYNVFHTTSTALNIGSSAVGTITNINIIGSIFTGGGSCITVPDERGVTDFVIRNCRFTGNTGAAISLTQTTVPATQFVTNLTVTNTSFDRNQTANAANLQVVQIQKGTNLTFQTCTFSRSGTGSSNLINGTYTGGNYSNLTVRDCFFYQNNGETNIKRAIYVQPVAANATLTNVTIEHNTFVAYNGSLNAMVNLQNAITGTITVRNNSMRNTERAAGNSGINVFGGTATYGTVTATGNLFNILGAGRSGITYFGAGVPTTGSPTIVTPGIAAIPVAGYDISLGASFSGATVTGVSVGSTVTASNNALNSTAATLAMFRISELEASGNAVLCNYNSIINIANAITSVTSLTTTGYRAPVVVYNSDGSVAGAYTNITNAMAAATSGQTVGNISLTSGGPGAINFATNEPTVTIPTGTITLRTAGNGRWGRGAAIPGQQLTFNNLTIPSGSTLRLIGDLVVNGALTINGSLDLNGYALVLDPSGTASGSGTITDATGFGSVIIRGTTRSAGTLNFDNAQIANFIDSIAGGGNYTLTGTMTLTQNGIARFASGSAITASALSITNSGYTFQGGDLPRLNGTGNLTVNSPIPVAITGGSGFHSINNLTVNSNSGAYLLGDVTVAGTLALTNGALVNTSNILYLNGGVTVGSGTLDNRRGGSVRVGGSGGNLTLPAFAVANNFTVNRSGFSVSLGSNLTTYGMIELEAGSLNLNGRILRLENGSTITTLGGDIASTNNNSGIMVQGPLTGGVSSAGNLAFAAAPNNRLGSIWIRRSLSTTGDVDVTGRLRVQRGTFNANSANVRFISNNSGTGIIDTVGADGVLSGFSNVTVQRWYGSTARWMLVGAPISGKTLNDWAASAPGTNGINFTFATGGGQQPSVFTFSNGGNWVAGSVATLSQTFAPGTGLRIYARSAFLNSNPLGVGPGVMQWTGSPVTGSFPFTGLTSSGNGWNLLANPYAAPLDWEQEGNWTRTNLQNTMMYWDNSAYRGLIKVGPTYVAYNSGTGIIPSGQGFFVQSTGGSPALTVTENAKTGSTPSFYRSGNAGVMRATLRNAAGASDEVIYHFDNGYGYTHNRDLAFDVPKLQNTAVNVGSFSADNVLLTADMRPVPTANMSIRMRVQGNATGAYTLTFTDLATGDWFLKDNKLGTVTNLSTSPAYAFNIDLADTTTFGNNRFELMAQPRVTSLDGNVNRANVVLYPNPARGQDLSMAVNGFSAGTRLELTFTDATGRVIARQAVVTTSSSEHMALPTALPNGIYNVAVKSGSQVINQKLIINN